MRIWGNGLFLAGWVVLSCLLSACTCGRMPDNHPVFLPAGIEPVAGRAELAARLEKILDDPGLVSGTTGIKVVRLTDSEVIYEENSATLFHPASTMKLFTSAAAFAHLGPNYRFTTDIAAEPSSIQRDTIDGNLYLVGSGDPSLETEDLDGLAAELHSLGVRRVLGDIVCDDTAFDDLRYGNGWMWDDQPYKDFAPIGALSVNRNTIRIIVAPGPGEGMPLRVRTLPETAFCEVNNEGTTVVPRTGESGDAAPEGIDSLTALRRWREGGNVIDVRGALPLDRGEQIFVTNVRGPALYTGTLFLEACRRQGIEVRGGVTRGESPAQARVLANHESERLTGIIIEMNKRSCNLAAELLLKAVGARVKGRPGTAEKGIEVLDEMVQQWGAERRGYRFADGSGVSRYGLVSADLLVALLTRLYDDFALRHEFVASLPAAGIDGSLEERMTGLVARGVVHAKTGSLSGVSALAGFARTADGEPLAFAILMGHFLGSGETQLGIQDRICDLLCRYLEAPVN